MMLLDYPLPSLNQKKRVQLPQPILVLKALDHHSSPQLDQFQFLLTPLELYTGIPDAALAQGRGI